MTEQFCSKCSTALCEHMNEALQAMETKLRQTEQALQDEKLKPETWPRAVYQRDQKIAELETKLREAEQTIASLSSALEHAITTLADLAFADDLNDASRRKKAERVYGELRAKHP